MKINLGTPEPHQESIVAGGMKDLMKFTMEPPAIEELKPALNRLGIDYSAVPALAAISTEDSSELVELRRSPWINRSIDNTALDAYMTCPWKFFASMVLSRRNQGAPPPPLAYGTAWHSGMEAHYNTGGDRTAVQRAIIMAWQPHSKPDDHRTVERCLLEYDRYVEHYGREDFNETVGFSTGHPMVEIPTEAAWPAALHPYCGKIDRIINLGGLYYVEDHKTTSALGQYYFQQFDPSNQMMGYAWLAQLLTGLPIAGVRINAHAVLKTISKFERSIVSFSQDRLIEWGANYNSWVERLARSFELYLTSQITGYNGVEQPLQLTLADPETLRAFPRNYNACAGKYGQCTYTKVCSQPPSVRYKVLEGEYSFNPWDPMASEDEGAE